MRRPLAVGRRLLRHHVLDRNHLVLVAGTAVGQQVVQAQQQERERARRVRVVQRAVQRRVGMVLFLRGELQWRGIGRQVAARLDGVRQRREALDAVVDARPAGEHRIGQTLQVAEEVQHGRGLLPVPHEKGQCGWHPILELQPVQPA